jgi:hypothetical protein
MKDVPCKKKIELHSLGFASRFCGVLAQSLLVCRVVLLFS